MSLFEEQERSIWLEDAEYGARIVDKLASESK